MDDKPIRRLGYSILLVTFGLFGGWATLAPLDGAALAPGLVTVKSYRKTVQHLEGGIVHALYVHEGDLVEAGQVLLELDNRQLRAELEMVRIQLIALLAQESRLQAEQKAHDGALPVPKFAPGDPRIRKAMASEEQIFQTRRSSLSGEISILGKTIVQLEAQIEGLEAMVSSKQELTRSYAEEITDLRALLAEGFIDIQRLRDQERSLTRLRSEIAEHRSAIVQARLRISETELQILQLNKAFASEVASQLGDTHTRVRDLRERLTAIQSRLERTRIVAPESGMVIGLSVHTVGGVVGAGTPLLDIVPINAELVVEARIAPTDIDRVAIGRHADIRFSAFKSSTTPVIEGLLTHISADRLIDTETGMPYYLGRLELTEKGHATLEGLTLLPGMPAEVLINTGERTLLNYLMQPAGDALARSLIED
ncbi:MAG: HlyD family type I secretion periplasmic adaptor subunit [Pseudomonas sp.]|nr:HlyD family type I secretion periplasmic adaptor subunit [Pseudomonas sp.]